MRLHLAAGLTVLPDPTVVLIGGSLGTCVSEAGGGSVWLVGKLPEVAYACDVETPPVLPVRPAFLRLFYFGSIDSAMQPTIKPST